MMSLFYFLVLIFSAVIHEVSHGLAAKAQGDNTAEYAGRLTLNPLRHLDPFGSILLPGILLITRSPI
ncbi:MAG: site-2 protease family protein, partial [Candidatus Paceibacteria bacterium]